MKRKMLSVSEDVELLKISYTTGGSINCYSYWKMPWRYILQLNISILYDLAILLFMNISNRYAYIYSTKICL